MVQHDFCLDDISSTFEDVFPIQKMGFPIAMFDSITKGEKTPEKTKPGKQQILSSFSHNVFFGVS